MDHRVFCHNERRAADGARERTEKGYGVMAPLQQKHAGRSVSPPQKTREASSRTVQVAERLVLWSAAFAAATKKKIFLRLPTCSARRARPLFKCVSLSRFAGWPALSLWDARPRTSFFFWLQLFVSWPTTVPDNCWLVERLEGSEFWPGAGAAGSTWYGVGVGNRKTAQHLRAPRRPVRFLVSEWAHEAESPDGCGTKERTWQGRVARQVQNALDL